LGPWYLLAVGNIISYYPGKETFQSGNCDTARWFVLSSTVFLLIVACFGLLPFANNRSLETLWKWLSVVVM